MSSSFASISSSQPSRGLSLYSESQGQRREGLSLSSSSSQSSGGLSLYSGKQGSSQTGFPLSFRDSQGNFSLSRSAKSQGDALIARELEEGALSLAKDQRNLEMINRIAEASIDQIIQMRQKIDQCIEAFIFQTTRFNDKYAMLCFKLAEDVVAGRHTEQSQVTNAVFLHDLARQVGNRYYETTSQLMQLTKLNHEGKLSDCKGVIALVFLARLQEIELFSKRLELLRAHDDHRMKVMVTLHNQELKAEAQLFDQYMQKAKFDSADEQRQFENSLAEREQNRKEEKDLQEMALSEARLDKEFRLENLKEENRKDIEKHATSSNERIEKARISSQERVAYAKAAASSSICTIS